MGKFIKIKANQILPSQDFLKEDTLRSIVNFLENHNEEKLPPTPIIREYKNKFIAIDGHNLLAIYNLLNKDCEVYLAGAADDKLPGNTESINKRNLDLQEKYEKSIQLSEQINLSFTDLCSKYQYLNSFDSAKKYFKLI